MMPLDVNYFVKRNTCDDNSSYDLLKQFAVLFLLQHESHSKYVYIETVNLHVLSADRLFLFV